MRSQSYSHRVSVLSLTYYRGYGVMTEFLFLLQTLLEDKIVVAFRLSFFKFPYITIAAVSTDKTPISAFYDNVFEA